MKNSTCIGKSTGKPLSQYATKYEAESAAEYSKTIYGNNLSPYECTKCKYWHLSPVDRITPSKECPYCTGRDGIPKSAYRSRSEASTRAKIIYSEKGIKLNVYQCIYSHGWHLTKQLS